MQIASITIRYGRKYQIADYDWVNLEASLHASIDEVEASTLDPISAAAELYAQHQAITQATQPGQPLPATIAALVAAELVPEPEPQPAPAQSAAPNHQLPRTSEEAQARFFARYGSKLGGTTWTDVQRFLDTREPQPRTVTRWLAVAERVRAHPTT